MRTDVIADNIIITVNNHESTVWDFVHREIRNAMNLDESTIIF